MAADDVYLALVKLDDEDVRGRVIGGDWGDLDGLVFTDDEQALVQGVIDEYASDPDVAGFAGGAMMGALGYCSGNVSPGVLSGNPPSSFGFGAHVGPGWGQASCGAGTCTAEPKKKMPGQMGAGGML